MGICILWRWHAAAILGPYPGQIVVKRGGCAHHAVLCNWGLIGGWWDYNHIASCKLPIRLIRAISCCWNHTLYSNHFIYKAIRAMGLPTCQTKSIPRGSKNWNPGWLWLTDPWRACTAGMVVWKARRCVLWVRIQGLGRTFLMCGLFSILWVSPCITLPF